MRTKTITTRTALRNASILGYFVFIQVLIARHNGAVNFDRNWEEYKQGFGDPHNEYYIG